MTVKRVRRGRRFWQGVLQKYELSGIGVVEFCSREGLSAKTFERWRARLRRPSSTTFVELVPSAPAPQGASCLLEVVLPSGITIRCR